MARLVVAPTAERDIESVLAWSHDNFGESARRRYEALLTRAITDIADNPARPGSALRPEIGAGVRTFHLFHSRKRVGPPSARVKNPRHFLLYRTLADGTVEIARVLHDSMDATRHLPDEHRDHGN